MRGTRFEEDSKGCMFWTSAGTEDHRENARSVKLDHRDVGKDPGRSY